jgi:DNA-binding HxlR family transcriptional regulator
VDEGSAVESSATENKDIIPNVNYTPTTDDKFQNKQDEKDDVADHIIADEKTNQILIQMEQNAYGSNGNNNRNEDSLPIIEDLLHNNDSKILSLLSQETGSNYSFKGLIRKLNLHQQSLTRALNRLEDLRLIDKSHIGYRLTKNGESLMVLLASKNINNNLERSSSSLLKKEKEKEKRNGYIQLLQTYISVEVKPDEILHALIGKWFNNLRWVGLIEGEDGGYMLQWVSDDNSSFQIILRVISDYLIIETNASSDKEKIEAMIGSYRIFEQISKILRNKLEGTGGIMHLLDVGSSHLSKQNN